MKILLVAATQNELPDSVPNGVEKIVTGVGVAHTIYHLTKKINRKKYDLLINIGIAGAIDKGLQIGEVVEVIQDEFFAFGSENHDEFLSVFELGLIEKNTHPFSNGKLHNLDTYTSLKKVSATTVQTTHGSLASVSRIPKLTDAQIETMEGAAFMYVCLMENIRFVQLRAVSNYVEPRNLKNWNIPGALENLHIQLFKTLDALCG